MTPFASKVITLIQNIPPGKIATYGQIARLAGKPHGARGVAWILNSSSKSHRLPWHRVLGSSGKISFPSKTKLHREQRTRLESEGVVFSDTDRVDFKKFLWRAKKPAEKISPKRPRIFS